MAYWHVHRPSAIICMQLYGFTRSYVQSYSSLLWKLMMTHGGTADTWLPRALKTLIRPCWICQHLTSLSTTSLRHSSIAEATIPRRGSSSSSRSAQSWRQQHARANCCISPIRHSEASSVNSLRDVENHARGRTRWRTHTPVRWKKSWRFSTRTKRLGSATSKSSKPRRSTDRTVSRHWFTAPTTKSRLLLFILKKDSMYTARFTQRYVVINAQQQRERK